MPRFGALMVLFALANAGLPGTSGFVGEFLVILAAFKASFWYAFLAASTLVLGAAYTLWLVKRVIYGPVANDRVAAMTDLNGREFWCWRCWPWRCWRSDCGRHRWCGPWRPRCSICCSN